MWGAAPAESETASTATGNNVIFIIWPFNEIYARMGAALKNTPPDRLNQVYSLQTRVSAFRHGFYPRLE
ncbi:hypothetical protein F8O53_17635 [Enterobacter sp. 63]